MNTVADETHECPACRQLIHARAVRCPHCRLWQAGRWTLVLWYAPICAWLLPCAAGALGFMWCFSPVFDQLPRGGRLGAVVTGVRVTDSRMVVGARGTEAILAVVGTLRNDEPRTAWTVELQVRFTDGAGRLVDVARDRLWWLGIAAGGETAFEVELVPELPLDTYADYDVSVRAASTHRYGL